MTFTSGTNTWTAPAGVTSVEVLVVGGGGGGGSHVGGGGGGGGVTENLNYSVSPSTSYSVTVGAGGAGARTIATTTSGDGVPSRSGSYATTGGSSSFGSITVLGGGHGASWTWQSAGSGANGGGGSGNTTYYVGATGSSGFKGGNGHSDLYVSAGYGYTTGGGAGANGNGGSVSTYSSGDGGAGKRSSITGLYYGGGGGGGFHDNTSGNTIAGSGGTGGGGAGSGATSVKAASGTVNTGGGGGGSGNPHGTLASYGGDGGSGLVLLSYVPAYTVTWDSNGGSSVSTPSTYQAGGSVSEPTAPTWSGKTFLGWSTSETHNQGDTNNKITSWPYSPPAVSDVTFYAIWGNVADGVCAADVNYTEGVAVYDDGTFCYVAFKSPGISYQWTPPVGLTNVNVLVVAGGGGGGTRHAGGGGAGGLIQATDITPSGTAFAISVGAGGAGAPGSAWIGTAGAYPDPSNGQNSSVSGSGISPLTAIGGGAGSSDNAAGNGGSGGGGSCCGLVGGSGTSGQGNTGSTGGYVSSSWWAGGAGGGAGGSGGNANTSSRIGAQGGAGLSISWLTIAAAGPSALSVGDISGSAVFFASGGGGGVSSGTVAAAQPGGGTAGGLSNTSTDVPDALANTGGGGGGSGLAPSGGSMAGGDGGSGVVVFRYSTRSYSVTWDSNGGSAITSPSTFLAGTSLSQPTPPSGAGKIFLGWSTSETSNQGDVNNKISSWPYTPSAANQTFYAIWADGLMSYESFTGTSASNLNGTSPTSTGLTGSWITVNATRESSKAAVSNKYVSATSLNFPANSAFSIPANNTAAGTSAGSWDVHYTARQLSNGINFDANDTYYLSFIQNLPHATGLQSGPGLLGFLWDDPAVASGNSLFMGTSYGSGFTDRRILIDYQVANKAVWASSGDVDNSYSAVGTKQLAPNDGDNINFLVAKIVTTSSGSDQIFLKSFTPEENLPTSEPTTWDVSYATALTGSANYVSTQAAYNAMVDEFRLGTTYNSVTNVRICSPTTSTNAGYTTYAFTATDTCTWEVPAGITSAEVLAVGAGGGGGWSWDNRGAGGGAGGQVKTTTLSLGTTASILVGQGGSGGISGSSAGSAGGSTSIDSFIALGGGGGCGGSGTCANSGQPATANTAAYGGSGGPGGQPGKGGGGSNILGATTTSTTGGAGTSNSLTGSAVIYGTGGNGGVAGTNIVGASGSANTGNGGSGASARSSSGTLQNGGNGGSGLLVLRVATAFTATYNYNGATSGNTVTSDTYNIGGSALTLPVPSKTGYLFTGWFADSALTTRVGLGGDSYTPSASVTLYAGWTNIVVNLDASKDSSLSSTPTSWVSVLPGHSSATGTIANAAYGTSSGIEYLSFSPTAASNVTFPAGTGAVTGAFTVEAWVNLAAMTSSDWNIIATRWFEANDWHFAIKKDSTSQYKLNLYTTGNNDLWGSTSFPSAGRDQWVQVGFTLDASGNLQFYVNGEPDGSVHTGVTHTAQATAKLRIGDDRTNYHYGFAGKMSSFRIYNTALSASDIQTRFNAQAPNLGYSALTVTFNANDSSGSPATSMQSYVSNIAQNLTTNAFTRSGYTFTGWNTQANGSGTAYTNSQSVSFTANTTLYAQWQVNSFTVTYNKNGATGSAERASDTFIPGSAALTLPTVATMAKTGYYFDGWATSVGGTKISGTYTPTANVTLYARWVAQSYTITYDNNLATSGSPSLTTDTYTTGGSAITLATQATMARSGYTFDGWSTTVNDASTKITNSGSYTITSSVILYALWNAVDYSVTYSTQGSTSGVAPTDSTAYNIGDNMAIRANTSLVKTGYSFAGWTLNSDGSGTVYQSGNSYTFGAASITLYPTWSANTYRITYNVNGASGLPSGLGYDDYTTGGSTISLPNVGTMVRTGYDFGGWSPSPSGSALNNNGYTTTSNITLYAVWTLKSINYSYSYGQASGTTVSSAQVANFPSTTTQSGLYGSSFALSSNVSSPINVSGSNYQFMGWEYNNSIYSAGDTFTLADVTASFTAIWVQLYEVRYGLNGGSGVTSADSECVQAGSTCLANQAITLHGAPTRAGYTFLGWVDQSGTTFAAGAATNVTASSYIFYAQWQAIDYTMTFNAVGGSTTPGNLTKNIGDTFTLPSPGTKTGYTFTGWFDGTSSYGAGNTYLVGASGVGFIAQWTPNVYTVSYSWNGGVGTPTADVAYTYGSTAITLPSGSSHIRDGYVFDGWSLTAGGTALSGTFTPTADTILYARWIDGSYDVRFNARGGSISQTNVSVARGNSMTLPTPVRAGFTFEGWYEDSSQTVSVGRGNSSHTPDRSRTMYAKWVQNSLAGIDPAHINSLTDITVTGAHTWSGSHAASGTGASLSIPNGALSNGTVVSVSYIEDLTRARDLIDTNYAYYSSLAVHWLTGTGDSATVPVTASGKPLTLTLTNPAILPGAKVFMIVDGVATEVATATLAGEVSIEISQDPEFVIAATNPSAPTSVTASAVSNSQSTVSWSAPSTTGGAAITDYTVTATPGGATCTTSQTSCVVSGLSDTTSYSFSVLASNVIGDSAVASTTVNYVPPVVSPSQPVNTTPTSPVVSSPTTSVTDTSTVSSTPSAAPSASRGLIEVTDEGIQVTDAAPENNVPDGPSDLPIADPASEAAQSGDSQSPPSAQNIVLLITIPTVLLFVLVAWLVARRRRQP